MNLSLLNEITQLALVILQNIKEPNPREWVFPIALITGHTHLLKNTKGKLLHDENLPPSPLDTDKYSSTDEDHIWI